MALISAPSYSPSPLHVPSNIQVYDGTPLWKKQMSGFLAQLATQAGGGLIDNALQRDYAAPADQKGFMDKLLHGAVMDRKQKEMGDQQAFLAKESGLGRDEAMKRQLMAQANDRVMEGLRSGHNADNEVLRGNIGLTSQEQSDNTALERQNALIQANADQGDRSAIDRLNEITARGLDPANQAQARHYNTEADWKQMQIDGVKRSQAEAQDAQAVKQVVKSGDVGTKVVKTAKELIGLPGQFGEFITGKVTDDPYHPTPIEQAPVNSNTVFEPNTLSVVPKDAMQIPESPVGPNNNVRDNERIADWIRSIGYGATNLVRPQNWRGNMDGATYVPQEGALPDQLDSRYNALSDKTSQTALHLQTLKQLLNHR